MYTYPIQCPSTRRCHRPIRSPLQPVLWPLAFFDIRLIAECAFAAFCQVDTVLCE